MFSQDALTDPLRRLALQLAIQLPESADEARQVMAMTSEVLDDFLTLRPAQRRARRLGWGIARPGDSAAAPRRSCAVLVRSVLLGLSSLFVTLPIALLLLECCGVGAGVTLMIGVTVVALVLDTAPALALAVASPLLHNLLLIPPALEFSRPTEAELVAAVAYFVLAILVPFIAARRTLIRDAVIATPPHERHVPTDVRLVG